MVTVVWRRRIFATAKGNWAGAPDHGASHRCAQRAERLAETLGSLYAWGGEQSDIHNDRGGNYADDHVSGKMDCIDHSTSTTRLLHLLVRRGYLRWHRVLEPQSRNFAGLVPVHWSAVIEETQEDEPRRFVVDSWFVDNGSRR
jgi:hypothetical protein